MVKETMRRGHIFWTFFSSPPIATWPYLGSLRLGLWGPSSFTVVTFLVLAIIWPIFFSIISSLKLIKHDWQEVVQITGLKGFRYLRQFLLPVTLVTAYGKRTPTDGGMRWQRQLNLPRVNSSFF